MKNLQDFYYKKFESDNYYDRWKKNDDKEYINVTKKTKKRKDKNFKLLIV